MKLQGVAALVTGGASGLGAATVKELAAAGARVAILDVNLAVAELLAREVGGAAVYCDVTSDEGAAKAIAEAAGKLGPARILINCAGVGTPGKAVSKKGPLPLAEFERTIRINLIGTFNMVRLAAAEMQKLEPVGGERGVIVNTASVAAYDGQVGQPAYAASKGGVVSLTLPLAREFADTQIRVCTIAPGLFETPLLATIPDDARKALVASTLHPKRLGTPAEFGQLARHIVENAMLNGETIRLDGAIRLAPR